tara:strand:- start:1023 stop:2063 length:1041 start_codon:yes stop_codon:yes gene_type:complete
MSSIMVTALNSITTMVSNIPSGFIRIGKTAMKMFSALKQFVFDKFGKPVMEKLGEIKEWWTGFKETVIEKWQGIKDFINDSVVTPVKEKWQGIKDFISDNVVDPIKEKWGTLKEWFTGLKETVIEKWRGIQIYILKNVIIPTLQKWQTVKDFFGGLKDEAILKVQGIYDFFSTKISNIWDSLPSIPELFTLDFWKNLAVDIGSALGGIGDFLIEGMKAGINGIISLINSMFASINFSKTIDLPGLDPMTVGFDLTSWSIPALAKGGIVNKPTLAMIGEDGPEAVVPLSQRNNPGGAGMGGGTYNITVNAGGITDRTDKRALAREIGNMIQQELARSIGGSTMRGRY